MNATPVTYRVLYNQKDITKDISDALLSLRYKDAISGEADEFEISVHDADLLWQNDWYPKKGDKIYIEIIDNDAVLNCGTFTIDEAELTGGRDGDIFMFRGISTAITKQLRTVRNTAHENKTLGEIARTVAARHGLTLQGTIDDIRLERVTQYRETDLSFLNRLASNYGYVFSIRDNLLTFTSVYELEKKEHILSLDKTGVTTYAFKSISEGTYQKANVSYHNPVDNEVVQATVDADEAVDQSAIDNLSANELNLTGYSVTYNERNYITNIVSNEQQAEIVGKSMLHNQNSREQTSSINCPGNILLLSGANVELTGFGKFSGVYHILSSEHSITRMDGYSVSFEAKKRIATSPAKAKPKIIKDTRPHPVVEHHGGLNFIAD